MEREETGIDGLDTTVEGGFPKGTCILLKGAPGVGKTTLSREFLYHGLESSEDCLYVVTNEPVSRVKADMGASGSGAFKASLNFIDGYSWRVAEKPDGDDINVLSSITELNELNRQVRALVPEGGRVVIDSVSDLLVQAEPESVFKYIQFFVSLVRAEGATAIIVLEDGVHAGDIVSMLEYLCDGVVDMKFEGTKRFVRIKKMFATKHPLAWIEYNIGDGIFLKISSIFKTANYPFAPPKHPKE